MMMRRGRRGRCAKEGGGARQRCSDAAPNKFNVSALEGLSVKQGCPCMFLTHSACRSLLFVIEVKHAPRFEFPFMADFVGSEVRQIVLSGNHWHATPRVTCCW